MISLAVLPYECGLRTRDLVCVAMMLLFLNASLLADQGAVTVAIDVTGLSVGVDAQGRAILACPDAQR